MNNHSFFNCGDSNLRSQNPIFKALGNIFSVLLTACESKALIAWFPSSLRSVIKNDWFLSKDLSWTWVHLHSVLGRTLDFSLRGRFHLHLWYSGPWGIIERAMSDVSILLSILANFLFPLLVSLYIMLNGRWCPLITIDIPRFVCDFPNPIRLSQG